MSVCLFVCQQVACDVVTVYSRSESPCHVSLSQSNRYRSFARPVDRSITIPRSVSRSVYLCLSVPVQRTTSAHAISFLRSSALSTSSLSLHLIPSTSHAPIPPIHEVTTSFIPRDRSCTYKTPDEFSDTQENLQRWANEKSWPRKWARIAEEHDEEGQESGMERRTVHRRPIWAPRTKLTRYVNCLSNLSPRVYTDI